MFRSNSRKRTIIHETCLSLLRLINDGLNCALNESWATFVFQVNVPRHASLFILGKQMQKAIVWCLKVWCIEITRFAANVFSAVKINAWFTISLGVFSLVSFKMWSFQILQIYAHVWRRAWIIVPHFVVSNIFTDLQIFCQPNRDKTTKRRQVTKGEATMPFCPTCTSWLFLNSVWNCDLFTKTEKKLFGFEFLKQNTQNWSKFIFLTR